MNKFYGEIGYSNTRQTVPGVWVDEIIEKKTYGNIIKNSKRYEKTDGVNDNINIMNQLSIIADSYAIKNYANIKYVKFMGARWKVTKLDIEFPRIILTMGGVYNGKDND